MGDESVRRIEGVRSIPETYRGPYAAAPRLDSLTGNHSVHLGHTGASVKEIQQLLNAAAGRKIVEEDKDYGPDTAKAVWDFQVAHGLKVDGQVGISTLPALRAAAAEGHRESGTSLPPSRLPQEARPNPQADLSQPAVVVSTIVPRGQLVASPGRDDTGHWLPRSAASSQQAEAPAAPGAPATTPSATTPSDDGHRAPRGTRPATPAATPPATTPEAEHKPPRGTRPTAPTQAGAPATAPRTPATAPRTPATAPRTPPTAPSTPATAPSTPVTAPQGVTAPAGWTVDQNGTAWPPTLDALPRGTRNTHDGRGGPRLPTAEVAPRVPRLVNGEAMPTPARDIRTQAEAEAELRRLGVTFRRVTHGDTLGVAYPVRIDSPLMGVELVPESNYHMTMDVRMAVAMAHFCMWARQRGVVAIRHDGGHVTFRDKKKESDPTILKTDDHGRGQAFDIGVLYVEQQTPQIGSLVPGSNPPRYEVVVSDTTGTRAGRNHRLPTLTHWSTARSSADISGGDTSVRQTTDEFAGMSAEERLLRESWGFWETEGTYTVTPSNNPGHHNHLHFGMSSTSPQYTLSMRSFGEYLGRNTEIRTNGKVPGYEDRQIED